MWSLYLHPNFYVCSVSPSLSLPLALSPSFPLVPFIAVTVLRIFKRRFVSVAFFFPAALVRCFPASCSGKCPSVLLVCDFDFIYIRGVQHLLILFFYQWGM